MKKKANLKARLIVLQILSLIVSAAPLLIYVFINWNHYAKTPGDTIKISVGLVIAIILFLLKVIGKLKMPKRVVTYSVIVVLSYFLYPLIQDIVWLSMLCLAGEVADLLLLQRPIKKLREDILIGKTADATTKQVKEEVKAMFDEYIGGRS